MDTDKVKSKFYPYVISLVIVIYITTQFLTIASTSNTALTLKEVAQKQKVIFEFLIGQSIESSLRTSSIDNVLDVGINHKDVLLKTIGFNNNIKVYDLNFFDLEGNLLNENYEGITSFSTVFGNLNPESIIEPTIVNIRYSKIYADTVMDILLPVYENGRIVAIMWQTESFERINFAMKNVSILNSGESYVIDENGVVLTDLRKVETIDKTITIKEEKIIDSTLDGFESKPYLDYNDEYVYGYHINLNFNKWKLIVEVDETEISSTATGVNSFLVRAVTLILALSKILEPVITKRKKENKNEKFVCNDDDIKEEYKENNVVYCDKDKYARLKKNIKKVKMIVFITIKLIIRYLWCIIVFYRNRKNTLNLIILIMLIIASTTSIYKIKTDNDIQNTLNSSSQVNRRLISYYVNEVKGQFYLSNRIITEFSEVDAYESLKRAKTVNSNILNIAVLDENNNELYNDSESKLNNEYIIEASEAKNNMYNSVGISDIFYDIHYGQYVYYMSGNLLDHKTNEWRNVIGVVSADNLIFMLNNNEVHSSRMITLLNDREIMYSNAYTENELSEESYSYLKTKIDSSDGFSDSVFDVNKYENMNGLEVYGNYSNIYNNKVVVYGSYGAINDTKWQLLYEEPTSVAQKRVLKGTIDLLINVAYQYIENMVELIG